MESKDTAKALWEACLKELEAVVTAADYNNWFRPLQAYSFDADERILTIEVPVADIAYSIENRYLSQLGAALESAIGPNVRLRYKLPEVSVPKRTEQTDGLSGGYGASGVQDPYVGVALRGPLADPQLNSSYTFDNYVVGPSNRMAASVAEAVAQAPGKTAFNPLFVYGGPGVGKTHLIQAIGSKVKAADPSQTVTYLSADRFMRQYMDARNANSINGFLRFYQGVHLLILDDIQELGGRQGTADVFFQIFNHLLQNGRQVVLASDKKPTELSGLPERLLSRFKSGMVAEVSAPDRDTRLGIVQAKAEADGLSLPDDVAMFVASNVSGNARELQGALVSLLAYATLTHTDVTLDLARQVVADLVTRPKPELITMDTIIAAVCSFYKIETSAMQQNSRKREIVMARQIAMYLCKKFTTDSLATIGRGLGNRNHSTVVYAVRSVEGLIDTDPAVAEAVKAIESELRV